MPRWWFAAGLPAALAQSLAPYRSRLAPLFCLATRELELVCNNLPVTPAKLRNIILAGFKGSFYPGPYIEKRALVRQVINRYDALEKQYLGM